MVYFSEFFDIEKSVLDEYGAFDISLINDLPLFIDPFLLYGSTNPEIRALHDVILRYLAFLRDRSSEGTLTSEQVSSWYFFPEVKQNWMGFCRTGNTGSGLGRKFGDAMAGYMHIVFNDVYNEKISETSHLEKAALFQIGVGKDNISDFTCNIIKDFLLTYTQEFARNHLKPDQFRPFMVEKSYFNYDIKRWMAKKYDLPFYNNDYIILTPRDILTKDENWINGNDLRGGFMGICNSIPNASLRSDIQTFYASKLPAPTYTGKGKNRRQRSIPAADIAKAINYTLLQYPEILDYYIRKKEADKTEARSVADTRVEESEEVFHDNVKELIALLIEETDFYSKPYTDSYTEALERVVFLKDVIENKDGYRLFYAKGRPLKRESDLQVIYRLTWYSTPYDVNREVNNGRGPADYTVSFGAADKTIVEFKLASNSKLKAN